MISKATMRWKGSMLLLCIGMIVAGVISCGEAEIEKIEISPRESSIKVGETLKFEAIAFSDKGKEIEGLQFKWSVEGEAGEVNESGLFEAQRPGKAVIFAGTMGREGEAIIKVISPEKVTEESPKELSPAAASKKTMILSDVIMIDNQGFERRIKGPVKFSHSQHSVDYGVECRGCHHDYKGGNNIWTKDDPVKRCAACHTPGKKQGEILKLKNAYHMNCKTCHKVLRDEGKSETAPYRKCNGCHEARS